MLSAKKLLYKIADFLDSTKLQEKTVTGTTNGFGAINLELPNSDYYVCSVRTAGYRTFPMLFGASTYALVMNDASTFSPATNKSVTVYVRYRRAIVGGGYCVTSAFSRLSAIASHLKGWWSHVKHKETSVQNALVPLWRFLLDESYIGCCVPKKRWIRSNSHLRTDERNNIVATISNNAKWIQTVTAYILCGNVHNEQHKHNLCGRYGRKNHDEGFGFGLLERRGNDYLHSIGSSISERGWAVC